MLRNIENIIFNFYLKFRTRTIELAWTLPEEDVDCCVLPLGDLDLGGNGGGIEFWSCSSPLGDCLGWGKGGGSSLSSSIF